MKLAVFSGQYFWFNGNNYSTDEAFVKFVMSFYPSFEKIVFCDAVKQERKRQPYLLNPRKFEVCPLPDFTICSFGSMLISAPRIYRIVRDNMWQWDLIWVHAPHPVSLIFAYVCRQLHKPFFLFVRQNFREYIVNRSRGKRFWAARMLAFILEHAFRTMSSRVLTFTVGREMYEIYGKTGRNVCQTAVSLIHDSDIDSGASRSKDAAVLRMVTVGRLDPEKGMIYLIEAVSDLVRSGTKGVMLDIVGDGSEGMTLRRKVDDEGLSDHVVFRGYIPHGEALFRVYRQSDVLILPSLTEGCPQVLFEAMACGVAIVATRVGGIPFFIEDGGNGLLVNPASPGEIVSAILRLKGDRSLLFRLANKGIETARKHTVEIERQHMLECIERHFNAPLAAV
ncbi:MAG: glycosyltransferase [Thermodesulfobacteriota bacterium]|nr:glycosyltransferase [Thermodesulfobacteriota bacterium]